MSVSPGITSPLEHELRTARFARLASGAMRALLEQAGGLDDWAAFADSWNRLSPDTYMADGGRYRRRRHAVFSAADIGAVERGPHQPHYQSRDYNSLNGGVERWFEPVEVGIANGTSCQRLLDVCRTIFARTSPSAKPWIIEMHQFRIEAKPGTAGKPTPEGMHRDGVDFVVVMMIRRQNIKSGETIMADANKAPIGRFTLTEPFDAVLLDDTYAYHGVTPVEPIDPGQAAYRDVLVLTFKRGP